MFKQLIDSDYDGFAFLAGVSTVAFCIGLFVCMVGWISGESVTVVARILFLVAVTCVFMWWGYFGMPVPVLLSPEERRVLNLEREAAKQEKIAALMSREKEAQSRLDTAFRKQERLVEHA
jgi:hypothetical protein